MTLIDNINSLLGDDLKNTIKPNAKVKIAASYFSMYAYDALKSELGKIDSLEFLFTDPTFIPNEVADKINKEKREFFIPKANRENALYGSEFEIQLRNKLTQRAVARECAAWVRNKVKFRSNKSKSQMQQFICIQNPETNATYTSPKGFTAVDLGYQKGDSVSNFVNKFEEANYTSQYIQLFNQIWDDASKIEDVTDAICDHIESVYQENSPERIYFTILYNIFNAYLSEVNEDVLPNDKTGYQDTLIWKKLFNFQKDAATGIINKLETYNGCILADSVGLGKTFTALAVVKYYELRNKSVLVLCPKKLADNWITYKGGNLTTNIFHKDRFSYDVLNHTDLSRTSGTSHGLPLNQVNWGNYDLIVIDESHNFRNNEAFKEKETRYQKLMNKVIRAGVKTKVLMLSATPVNNRFADLRNQLALAYEGNSGTLGAKLKTERTVEEIFRRAQAAFNEWTNLPAEERTTRAILDTLDFDFFELLDSVTIARSRKHIETFYDTNDIGKFPERRKPLSFRPPLTHRTDVMSFDEIFEQLSKLTLAVYAPLSYILDSRKDKYDFYDTQVEGGRSTFYQEDREISLQKLITTNLLKRLESSVEAFRLTLGSLSGKLEDNLESVRKFETTGETDDVTDNSAAISNIGEDDDYDFDEEEDNSVGGKTKIDLKDVDVPRWKNDLNHDLTVIEELLASMRKITTGDDAKLQHLIGHVFSKIENPINSDNKKILIFTAYADTANYLYENLSKTVLDNHKLHSAIVTGEGAPKTTLKRGYDFQSILTLFSPRSKEKAIILPDEKGEIDVLIGTDCISEGQNLQDCDYLINYDIHWNPVRIIQRFGRIDRIGSTNETIQLVNYWPDISLDEYINLKQRVEDRMKIADLAAGGDDNPLTAKSNDLSYRREQLRRLQEEVIELEDVKTGISITDLGLNDFKMDLNNYVKENGDLEHAPKGLHAVVPAQPEVGLMPGAIFALRNINEGVNINQQNRLHPYYLIYIAQDGQVVANHTEAKKLLDLLRKSCKGQHDPILALCRLFNKQTDDGRNMAVQSDLLNKAIRSMMDLKEEKDLDSLFTGGRTTALVNTISGLDDFELIAFLVIQSEHA